MLRHTPTEVEQAGIGPAPAGEAAKVRVTPDELVQAMAAIQARREREARERDGTIAIGDAVQELGLDATPEEILAAVEAQRRRRAVPAHRSPQRRRPLRTVLLAAVFSASGLIALRGMVALTVAPAAPPAMLAPGYEAPPLLPPAPAVGDLDHDGRADLVLPMVPAPDPSRRIR